MDEQLREFEPEKPHREENGTSSPSRKWLIRIQYLDNENKGHWSSTRALIANSLTMDIVLVAERNYPSFPHDWVVKDGCEYLMCSENYMAESCLCPEHRQKASLPQPKQESFCWSGPWALSPDGKTLAVAGCFWAAPYEIKFYDFTDPMALPYPKLQIIDDQGRDAWVDDLIPRLLAGPEKAALSEYDYYDSGPDPIPVAWNEDGSFSIFKAYREGNTMVFGPSDNDKRIVGVVQSR